MDRRLFILSFLPIALWCFLLPIGVYYLIAHYILFFLPDWIVSAITLIPMIIGADWAVKTIEELLVVLNSRDHMERKIEALEKKLHELEATQKGETEDA